MENFMELMDFEIEELDIDILKSHERAEMLSKKGYKVKIPKWKGLIAS